MVIQSEDESLFPAAGEWERLRDYCAQLEGGAAPAPDAGLAAYLVRVGKQVGLTVPPEALGSPSALATLAVAARSRIRDGSRRLMAAMSEASSACEAGDAERARALLDDVVATEVVPWYREQARRHAVNLGLAR